MENIKNKRELKALEIIEHFNENPDDLTDCVLELQQYNGFASDEGVWFPMELLDDCLKEDSAHNIILSAYLGRDLEEIYNDYRGEDRFKPFNPNRNYFRFNALDNLDSCDYIDYSHLNDEDLIMELLENRAHLYTINSDWDLSEMFDELEELGE